MLGPWLSVGVQLKAPVVALIVAPAGRRQQAIGQHVGRRSASVAVAVNVSRLPSLTVLFAIAANTGPVFGDELAATAMS